MPFSRRKLTSGGYTLVELMISVALIAIVTTAVISLYASITQGMAADEMHGSLQQGNQNMLNRIRIRLASNKHCFFGDASGVSFIGVLNFTSGSATAPATVAGTSLSQLQTNGSGSPRFNP